MCFKGIAKTARSYGSPSRMIVRAINGKDPFKAEGATTFRNIFDEQNITGLNPEKKPEDMTAEEQEAARQKRIAANVKAINDTYAGREGQYADFGANLQKKYMTDLDRQQKVAGRNLKFELAGAGLTGGSQATDAGADLGREMAEGTVTAQSKANQAEADLRGADESARLQLISLAQAGGDIGNAGAQSATMLQNNLKNAQSGAAGTIGDVFGSTAQTYKQMQEARNMRRGLTSSYEQIYGSGIGRPAATVR